MSGQDHKQALPAGYRLASYRVVRVLGVGGFGVTYLCEHAGLGVQVAVKEYLPNEIAVRDGAAVHPKSAGDREGFEWGLSRFLDEARTLARFEHPNVVRVRDCLEANSTAYIVMDYEDGEPLDRLLQRLGTLTEAQLKRVVLPVAEGLREVHAAGFLHRDIKPSNIFVRRSDESPVLLDFGSARQALGRKSRSMTAIASAGYSPPEQYESQGSQGAWTDIYALCALCHRAITGEVPVEAPRRTGEVARQRADPQARLAAGVAGYSSCVLDAVDWGLQLIETKRPQCLEDWLERLQNSTSVGGLTSLRGQDEQGHAAAQYELGFLYEHGNGKGDLIDYEAAAVSYLRAAAQGHAKAQYRLGLLYHCGFGVPEDVRKAAEWYRKAAEQGDPDALPALAQMYQDGSGVPKDACEAALWYRKAAEKGDAKAQRNLGWLYQHGEGVPKDAGMAARWYRKAAEQGNAWAVAGLTSLRGQAEQGHAKAQYQLGSLYKDGKGVLYDFEEAALWFFRAAAQGHAKAQYQLGRRYEFGNGVPRDVCEAALWYRKAAENGDAEAQRELGRLYQHGKGVPKDAGMAARWYRKAAEQGAAGAPRLGAS